MIEEEKEIDYAAQGWTSQILKDLYPSDTPVTCNCGHATLDPTVYFCGIGNIATGYLDPRATAAEKEA